MSRFSSLYPSSSSSSQSYRPRSTFPRPALLGQPFSALRPGARPFTPRPQYDQHASPRPRPVYGSITGFNQDSNISSYQKEQTTDPTYNAGYGEMDLDPVDSAYSQEATDPYSQQATYEKADSYSAHREPLGYEASSEVYKSSVDGHVTPMAFRRGRGFINRGRGSYSHDSKFEKAPVQDLHDTSWGDSSFPLSRGRGTTPTRGFQRGRGQLSNPQPTNVGRGQAPASKETDVTSYGGSMDIDDTNENEETPAIISEPLTVSQPPVHPTQSGPQTSQASKTVQNDQKKNGEASEQSRSDNSSKVSSSPTTSSSERNQSNPNNMISSFAQSLISNSTAMSKASVLPRKIELPPHHQNSNAQNKPLGSQHQNSPEKSKQDVTKNNQPSKSELGDKDGDPNEEEDSEEEIDTGYCQYCNINFSNPDSYWKHTRGILHTQKLMDYEKKKKEEGEQFFKTEKVDAGPQFEKRDHTGKRILSSEEKKKVEEDRRKEFKDQIRITMATTGEGDDGEYDFNRSNWMEVDTRKVAAKDKDLNPEDLGREQFPDEFYCEVCDVRCTGAVTFKMHVEGNKHKTKSEKVATGKPVKSNFKIVPTDKPATLASVFETIPDPLIGLQYVTEFQRADDRPKYVCNLCESKCDPNSIVAHIIGIKHRIKYFKEHYPETYQKMLMYTSRKKSEQNGFAEEFARDVEAREGRQDVKVKLEVDISTELAAADLIKSGALDHLLEGTGLTREKLQKLDVDSLRPEPVGDFGHTKIDPVIKQDQERSSIELSQKERLMSAKNKTPDRSLPSPGERLLPSAKEREQFYSSRPGFTPKADNRLSRRSAERTVPERPPVVDPYLRDRYGRGYEDNYGRPRYDRDPYASPYDRRYDDPYYPRRDLEDPYMRSRYPDYRRSPPPRHDDTPALKPVVVMDYGHSKKPVVEKILGADTVDDDTMKRKAEEPKTEEELFQEFLKWKKFKSDPGSGPPTASTVTAENYQFQPTSAPPVQQAAPSQQPMDVPSYTTSDESTQRKGGKADPASMIPNQKDLPPQVQELMATLSKSMIHTEDEAAMALQVSNALTQALLEYQLKNTAKELQNTIAQQQKTQNPGTQNTGKAETKKSSVKKQRFDAYSMIPGSKTVVSSATSQSNLRNYQSSAVTSQSNLLHNIQMSAVNHSQVVSNMTSAQGQNVMASMPVSSSMYPPQGYNASSAQAMMTSQAYGIPTQGMMMSSPQMMTSPPMAGIPSQPGPEPAGFGMPPYQQFQGMPPGQGQQGNIQSAMPWGQMYGSAPYPYPGMPHPVSQPPLPTEEQPPPPPLPPEYE